MAKFRPNLGQLWLKRAIFEISQKKRKHFFFRLQRLCFEKKLGKSDARFSKKMRKTSIFGHFGPKRPILAKLVKMIKKALGKFFLTFWTLTSYKISEKSNERFPSKRVTNERAWILRSQATSSIDQQEKITKMAIFGFSPKNRNRHFFKLKTQD